MVRHGGVPDDDHGAPGVPQPLRRHAAIVPVRVFDRRRRRHCRGRQMTGYFARAPPLRSARAQRPRVPPPVPAGALRFMPSASIEVEGPVQGVQGRNDLGAGTGQALRTRWPEDRRFVADVASPPAAMASMAVDRSSIFRCRRSLVSRCIVRRHGNRFPAAGGRCWGSPGRRRQTLRARK